MSKCVICAQGEIGSEKSTVKATFNIRTLEILPLVLYESKFVKFATVRLPISDMKTFKCKTLTDG